MAYQEEPRGGTFEYSLSMALRSAAHSYDSSSSSLAKRSRKSVPSPVWNYSVYDLRPPLLGMRELAMKLDNSCSSLKAVSSPFRSCLPVMVNMI